MLALQLQQREFNFTTYDEVLGETRKMFNPDYTFVDFCNLRDWIIDHEDDIMAMLKKLTLPLLKKRIALYHGGNKSDYMEGGYEILLSKFNIVEEKSSYKMQIMEYDEVHAPKLTVVHHRHHKLLAKIKAVALEHYEQKREEVAEEKAVLQKALDNPQTLEEFRTFARHKGVKSFTPEQMEAYDKVLTDERREQRQRENKRHSIIGGVELGDAQLEIIKSFHTKHKIDIWMVRLDQWIRPSLFRKLLDKAKTDFNGYYSSYKVGDAIPGFLFWNEEHARLFTQLKEGDVDVSGIHEDREFWKLENRIMSLREKAACLLEMGEEEYNRDRKTNTPRRVGMATNAEARAARKMILGKILYAIAEGQENGKVEYLDRFSFISDLETFELIISWAKQSMFREKEIPYRDQEAVSLSTEWANYIKFPYPTLDIETCMPTVLKAQYEDGKKMAAARFIKRFKAAIDEKRETYFCMNEQAVEDFARIFVTDDDYCQYYGQLRIYNRVMRMNLQSTPELRTAIREYIRIKLTISLTPEQQQQAKILALVRSFVGRKIPGFFPMTRELALAMIEKANIEPGNVISEPSAGLGHLADVIVELHPGNELHCTEINYDLAEVLKIKGHNVQRGNFLEDKPQEPQYDRILMNPPFENRQDNEHVMHAFNHHLKIGGRLVAIMADNKGNTDFENWVERLGGTIEENPKRSFASAFNPTGISTITVILDK